jgi:hypothetical protein
MARAAKTTRRPLRDRVLVKRLGGAGQAPRILQPWLWIDRMTRALIG